MQFWKGESLPSACLDFAPRGGTIGWVLVSRKVSHPKIWLGQLQHVWPGPAGMLTLPPASCWTQPEGEGALRTWSWPEKQTAMWKGEFLVGVSTDALVADQAPILEGVMEKSEWGQPRNKGTDEGISLVVQWLRLHAPNVGGPDLIPGQGTRSHMPKVQIHMP